MKLNLLVITTMLACMAGCENWGDGVTETDRERTPPPPPPSDVDRPPPPILDDTAPSTPPADRDAGSNVTLQPTDRTFIEQAISGGMFEVQSAELALKQEGLSEDLKSIAQMIVDDHRAANDELKAMAEGKGFAAPVELQAKHQEMLEQLREPSDVDFGA